MEREFVDWLRGRLQRNADVSLAFEDDAAVLRASTGERMVVSVDLLTEGVDFELERDDARRVGRKALAVNLSDLAAMAARPVAAVVALALPRPGALELAQELYEGLIPLAERFELAIVGGDTNTWDGPLVVSVTVLGEVGPAGPLVRSGAQPGDWIITSGAFGGSRLGHQFDFVPRVDEALHLAGKYPLHAGIDTSDGLSLDLARLARASGCAAELRLDQVPVAEAAERWAKQLGDGSTALEHALGDGEDFELILAIPPEAAAEVIERQPLNCRWTRVGQFVAGTGLWQVDASGTRQPLAARGFEH